MPLRRRSRIHHNVLKAYGEASSDLCVVRHNLIEGRVPPRWNTSEGDEESAG